MMSTNYYVIFEISSSASPEEIKSAYRRLAMEYHPDRYHNKGAGDAKMKEINFIYSILSDPKKRSWYDSTISFSNESSYQKSNYYSQPNIYCKELEMYDSLRYKFKAKVGDSIFYLVEIDKSVITWKYKSKEYFELVIKKIFDPSLKELFTKIITFEFNKTPLFLAHWGNSEIIIYKEDFEEFWISQDTYAKIDKKNGLYTGIIIIIILCVVVYYFYNKLLISDDSAAELRRIQMRNENLIKQESAQYKKDYFATDKEVSYILTKYYFPCDKHETSTTRETEVYNIPDVSGTSRGTLKKGEEVQLLLFCSELRAYKVKSFTLMGWVSSSSLDRPSCNNGEKAKKQN